MDRERKRTDYKKDKCKRGDTDREVMMGDENKTKIDEGREGEDGRD